MKNRILVVVIIILTVVLVVQPKRLNKTIKEENKTIKVKDNKTGSIKNKDLEEYVIGVVAAEMPASFHEEALKAQAIASRTYAYYKMKETKGDYDIISDISDQAYITTKQMKEKWQNDYDVYYEKIKNAVLETKGEVMTYNKDVIEAFYFAMSNGYTEDVSSVFNEDRPYLKSVESKWDNNSLNKYEVITTITKDEFCKKLNISCETLTIDNQTYDKTGRTQIININSKEFKGTEFRKLLDLRSTDFKIDIENNNINITTKGYGHGVGMSQYGANGMALEGYNYKEILNYYYNDIKIEKI